MGQTLCLGADRNVDVSGMTTLPSGSALTIDGGRFKTGLLSGPGKLSFVSGTFALDHQDLVIGTGGLLGKSLSLPIERNLIVAQDLVIDSSGQFTSNGGGTLNAGRIVKHGQIIVDGLVSDMQAGSLENSGRVIGNGRLGARFTNATAGQVRVDSGELMQFAGSSDSSNNGAINVLSGTFEVAGNLANNASGVIAGRGTVVGGGPLQNCSRINNGSEIRVSAGSMAV